MSPQRSSRRRFWISLTAPILALGCSVIATSDAEQCASDTDCYVKFGGGFTCQSGGCVAVAQSESTKKVVTTLDVCRSTQECVASLGEGWLCRRDRSDPQKSGKCQQLTPTPDCRILGDYKNDQAIMLGALLPGKDSPALAANVLTGLELATRDWENAIRTLQATNTGPDAVAPPRPFAVVACSEDIPRNDLRNLFLNTGVALVIGPSTLKQNGTLELATELTTALVPLVSPTSLSAPTAGSNVGTYFFRVAGLEEEAAKVMAAIPAPAPPSGVVLIRRAGAYEKIAAAVKAAGQVTEQTYDTVASFNYGGNGGVSPTAIVLGDGEAAAVLAKLPRTAEAYILPTAIPDVMAALKADQALPGKIQALRSPNGPVTPTPPFGAGAYGAPQAYDALYTALVGIAAIGDDKNPELVKEIDLANAVRRATSVTGTKNFRNEPTIIREVLKELRSAPEMTLKLSGASGEMTFSPDTQTTVRTFSLCAVTENNCIPN